MKAKELPPLEVLNALFEYNPETGELRWKKSLRGVKRERRIAGCVHSTGYRVVILQGKQYKAHRIIYALFHNEHLSPEDVIDHINGTRDDNRIANLRKTAHSGNMQNRRVTRGSASGVTGVTFVASTGKWQARISHNNEKIYIGSFENKEDAIVARRQAEVELGFLSRKV